MKAVAALLRDLKAQGKIKKVAVAYVNDLFGIELNTATGPAFKEAGLEVVDTKSYPLGAKDLSPVLKGFKAAGADAFVGLTYPPDNILVTAPGEGGRLEPAVFFTGVGHGVPVLPRPLQGRGGRDGHRGLEPEGQVRGRARVLRRPREEAPEGAGPLGERLRLRLAPDPGALRGRGRAGPRRRSRPCSTPPSSRRWPGPIKFTRGENVATPGMVGQWQKNEFELVWPKSLGHGQRRWCRSPAWA